ncbi:MAG: thioesterase family protein [Xanthobacteraceae bacterium]|nr:thioesterase family protein [Xanthobacteraceae bacterium]QYK44284.1 MAG: thioesterase family protein [Xanthobacteraceae bacterium]HMN51588.1 thioesterase family protein [Xanthobacteraceae bacterium]
MLQRLDFEPVFFAPFVSSAMTVEPAWIDYNGHLNMAYYNVLIDRAVDEAFALVGLGPEYLKERSHSFFTAECHVRYLRELQAGQSVRTTIRLIDYDEKRIHFFAELYHAVEGWMSATSEQMALHVDMASKKVVPLPDDVLDRLAAMKAAHAALPAPEGIGRKIGMPKRS